MNEQDYIVNSDGSLSGLPAGQFQYGDRFVQCYCCKTKRPANELEIKAITESNGNKIQKPTCKDYNLCLTLGKHLTNLHSND